MESNRALGLLLGLALCCVASPAPMIVSSAAEEAPAGLETDIGGSSVDNQRVRRSNNQSSELLNQLSQLNQQQREDLANGFRNFFNQVYSTTTSVPTTDEPNQRKKRSDNAFDFSSLFNQLSEEEREALVGGFCQFLNQVNATTTSSQTADESNDRGKRSNSQSSDFFNQILQLNHQQRDSLLRGFGNFFNQLHSTTTDESSQVEATTTSAPTTGEPSDS